MPADPDITPPAATSLVERLRAVHLQMLDAVLTGDGLAAVADLAAGAAGGPGAIVVPRLGGAGASPGGEAVLGAGGRHVGGQGPGRGGAGAGGSGAAGAVPAGGGGDGGG